MSLSPYPFIYPPSHLRSLIPPFLLIFSNLIHNPKSKFPCPTRSPTSLPHISTTTEQKFACEIPLDSANPPLQHAQISCQTDQNWRLRKLDTMLSCTCI